jgi:NAD(P)-dependent dehydrogenase (short-subunit alcohol dehydrogenase family)
VNNAGVLRMNLVWRFSEEDWDTVVDTSLKGYFLMMREVAPHMCGEGRGVIINTSSRSGFGHPSLLPYAAAKEGVLGLTRTAARELGRFGVRCNAIRPAALSYLAAGTYSKVAQPEWLELMDATMTPMVPESLQTHVRAEVLLPSRIAPFVTWLCTDAASDINGATFHVVGDVIARYRDEVPEKHMVREGGWTLEALDEVREEFVGDLRNLYTLDDRPDLQEFEL